MENSNSHTFEMVKKFSPSYNKVYFINNYTMFHILQGSGGIEVDFKSYHDWGDKLIFLEKGQYIKFLSENFEVRSIEFQEERIFRNKEVRVLFKHLVALGYINFKECTTCQRYLNSAISFGETSDIIDVSSEQWYWQNPFQANQEEYHIIFDIKDVIDQEYRSHLSNDKISKILGLSGIKAQALFQNKVGFSVKSMLSTKRMLESKKDVAFSNKSIKEIAYEFGFKDPSYFNRVFSKVAGKTPMQFREEMAFPLDDTFLPELYYLLENHHKSERKAAFYAEKMNVSIKTLSHKVKDKLNITLGSLIRQELVKTAKLLLLTDMQIKMIALELGFEEANHFSSFFKHYTSWSPIEFRMKSSMK